MKKLLLRRYLLLSLSRPICNEKEKLLKICHKSSSKQKSFVYQKKKTNNFVVVEVHVKYLCLIPRRMNVHWNIFAGEGRSHDRWMSHQPGNHPEAFLYLPLSLSLSLFKFQNKQIFVFPTDTKPKSQWKENFHIFCCYFFSSRLFLVSIFSPHDTFNLLISTTAHHNRLSCTLFADHL